MHFVIYLPPGFYSAIASTFVEILQAINSLNEPAPFTFEFVSPDSQAVSRSGIIYNTKSRPSKKIDVLVLLSGLGAEAISTPNLLQDEWRVAKPLIKAAQKQEAILAATCGASYMLAASGILNGKRATISWWLKKEVQEQFPNVRWEPTRILVRDGRIYTSGGGFSGLELITTLLADLGFSTQERRVRKLMVLPSSRQFQSPYEFALDKQSGQLEKKLNRLFKDNPGMNISIMAKELGMSPRTMARKFFDELQISPGKWIQKKRIDMSKTLLEETNLSIAEVCYQIGFDDPSSFSRLFSKTTGMGPIEFRKQIQHRPVRKKLK
ncbi:GlxA family transcriptional regulator [Chitinophaga ginsengisoli]|uniref:Transcriptional regulator GlxA family with amidase domain n=1 Tax=Chitinophaga ginsengisoli TaxID=363837 RepID=A0A2P8GI58_9BACT|nr:helix-turn-helix domain-containing protein [Chitinophaga ginsengisoli]PSL33627.1 transcriptional regulator GlxA family with amidase domain [Chitinophaga ginsengisoli]